MATDIVVPTLGESVSEAKIAFLREQYGFDKPMWQQFVYYWRDTVQGEFPGRAEEVPPPPRLATASLEVFERSQQLQLLRTDLERRRAAQQKVVEVQLRTIELAGEGLVELDPQP